MREVLVDAAAIAGAVAVIVTTVGVLWRTPLAEWLVRRPTRAAFRDAVTDAVEPLRHEVSQLHVDLSGLREDLVTHMATEEEGDRRGQAAAAVEAAEREKRQSLLDSRLVGIEDDLAEIKGSVAVVHQRVDALHDR